MSYSFSTGYNTNRAMSSYNSNRNKAISQSPNSVRSNTSQVRQTTVRPQTADERFRTLNFG
jgi:hypothetical protein